MLHELALLLQQAVTTSPPTPPPVGLGHHIMEFLDTPAPYSPFSEYLAVMFILWLLARLDQRRKNKKSFERQAQDVLEEKFQTGELSKSAYDKFRQDVSARPKK